MADPYFDYLTSFSNYGRSPAVNFGGPRLLTDPGIMDSINTSVPSLITPNGNVPVGGGGWRDFFRGAVGTRDNPGWGGLALGAVSGLGNLYLGMQQYGLAKDTLAENKRQFQMNWDAQRKTTNAALADRQAARLSADPNAYASMADYMAQYGI